MRWLLVFGAIPVPIFTGAALAPGVAGEARGPVVRIAAGYEADEGLLRHELHHVEQFWAMGAFLAVLSTLSVSIWAPLVLWDQPSQSMAWAIACAAVGSLAGHPLLYLCSRRYRSIAEASAYRVQMAYPDGHGGRLSMIGAAERLAGERYGLGITVEQAKRLLA